MRVVQNKPNVSIHAARRILEGMLEEGKSHGQGFEDVQNLASTISSVGFEDVSVDVFSSDRVADTRNAFNNSIIGAFAGMMKMFVQANSKSGFWASEEAAQLHVDAAAELANDKAYYRAEINVVCARKM